jgi:hypothetical protein
MSTEKISWKRERAGVYTARKTRGGAPLFEIENTGPGASPWELTSVYSSRVSCWVTLQEAKATAAYQLNAPKCATTAHGGMVLATCRISYYYRNEDQETIDFVCTLCAESYERRRVLARLIRLPLEEVRVRVSGRLIHERLRA